MRFVFLFLGVFAIIEPSFVRQDLPKKEDLVLIDGRYLHVKILSPNDRGIQVTLLETGGQVFIPWGLIDEPYRTDIMRRYGFGVDKEEKVFLEDGDHIVTKTGDTWDGRITNDNGTDITLKHHGTSITLPKSSIKEMEKTKVNALDIYKPEEYYAKRAAELKAAEDDIPLNMELGELAMDLELCEKAFTHYKRVQATDPGYEKEKIENILKRLEELSKNTQVRDALKDAQTSMRSNNYKKALGQFEALIALKEIPDSLKGEILVWKERCVKARYEFYRKKVRELFELKLNEKIRTLSRDDKLKLAEAQKKLRADVYKEIVADLSASLELDPKEVETMWSERAFHQPRIASYGSGSFIVLGRAPDADKYEAELNKYLQQSLQKQNQGKSSKSTGSLSAAPDKLPKPPTKEEWWTKVSTSSDREQWMKAYWAEQSKRVTVVGDRREDCSRCGGTGALQFSGTQGDTLRTTCPSCQGHKYYKGVAYK